MAKRNKKDEIEDNDNINRDTNDDINEADDNFGLPEVNYDPIDRNEDSSEEEETTNETEVEETYSSSSDDSYTSDETYTSDDTYNSSSTEEDDIYATPEDEAPLEDEKPYVPGSYKPPTESSSAPKIIAIIIVLLLAGAGAWYFGFYGPAQKAKEQARIETEQKAEQQRQAKIAADAKAEEQRRVQEQAKRDEEARLAAEAAKPKVGSVETISTRSGRYYVVIASAIDEDLAMDHAKKLSKSGVSATILKPFGKSKFHRIAVEDHDSWATAQSSADGLKGQYGDGVWVIRY